MKWTVELGSPQAYLQPHMTTAKPTLAHTPLKVCIVIPCYNEEGVLKHTTDVLLAELKTLAAANKVTQDSFICCVDDGSRDGTWAEILALSAQCQDISGLKLSANFGHQNALVAGLFTMRSRAQVLITIDADLQDDVSVIGRMVDEHLAGKRVVYGVRLDRTVDVLPKRIAADLYYRVIRQMNHRMVRGHADFRSADAQVVADLERFGEVNLYLRGIFPLIGYPSSTVSYARKERHAGDSKYSYAKLASLAWQGVTSFTTTPLRLVFYMGLIMFLFSCAIAAWVIWAILTEQTVQGWASTLLFILFFSSCNLIGLGVIGEYVGKIYTEVKRRPRYIIESSTSNG